MLSVIIYALPFVLSALLLAGIIGTYINFRRSRSATYFRVRRDAILRAWRWLIVAVIAAIGIAIALILRPRVPSLGLSFYAPIITTLRWPLQVL